MKDKSHMLDLTGIHAEEECEPFLTFGKNQSVVPKRFGCCFLIQFFVCLKLSVHSKLV